MKKLLNLALGLVALVAFTSISAAQEKKSPSPAAVPEANTVTLSATSSNVISKKGCPVTAWVGFVNDQGKKFPLQYMVNIVKVSPTGGSTPASGKADTKGEWKINVPNNTVIRATV